MLLSVLVETIRLSVMKYFEHSGFMNWLSHRQARRSVSVMSHCFSAPVAMFSRRSMLNAA